ncbi:MAG: hypothetical protein K2H13_09715 [Eubacterium sp.]|nr:hypothetical protein [Eubacterium sp.]MDE6156497.1 hypothetical protein [Eubacterium sp.]
MNKKSIVKIISVICSLLLITALSGCSLNSYSVDELKVMYPKAFENSLSEELYYWKETVNTSNHTSWRTCNVFTEIDKKYEPIRDENGEFANMKIDVYEEYNKKASYKALCGKSNGSNDVKSFLFENNYDESGSAVNYRKTEITPQAYIASADFNSKFSLNTMLSEFEYLGVDDMIFDIDNDLMEHKGKVVKFSFTVTSEYLERYKTEFGTASVFENSKYATMEFAYDRFASIVVYAEENLGGNISADKEVYKLEVVYFGPIVNIPSYDSDVWANA